MTGEAAELELFLRAIELPAGERARFVAAIEDAAVRTRVEELLQADAELAGADPFSEAVAAQAEQALSPLVGTEVDGFRIVREIGRGGMGVVFEAEQATPRRRVALKTLPLTAAADDESQRRLANEAETLARLSHPGIAQVYGCGHAAAFGGVPYLVMELVDGVPPDTYCREHGLDHLRRLELLARVCDAVGHAHEAGVVHRDLKPQNVLVRADGAVKVLDFGIAKVVGASVAQTLRTQTGQLLGTLTYMAPEQLTVQNDRAPDPRTDVYALGVLGYQLLAGRAPVELPEGSLAGALRHLIDCEPMPLAAAVPSLRGDIAVVFGKAMDKEPERRYADADEFARDLRRLVADQPVVARPPSAAYQMRKFVRRNRATVGSLVAIVVALAVGLVWALQERQVARQEQRRAERLAEVEQQRSRSMTRMIDLLGQLVRTTTPQENDGRPPSMEDAVNALSLELDDAYADDPFLLGNTHLLLVDVMTSRAETQVAAYHLERARAALDRSELAGPRAAVLLAIGEARVAEQQSRIDDAIAHLERARELAAEVDDAKLRRRVVGSLCNLLTGVHRDLPRAERLLRGILAEVEPEGGEWRSHQRTLARALGAQDKREQAIEQWQLAIRLARRHYPGSLRLATCLQNLGMFHQEHGDEVAALPLLKEALDIRREVLRDDPHPELGIAIDNFAVVLRDRGQLEESLELSRDAERIFRAVHRGPHIQLAVCLTEQAVTLRDLQRPDDSRQRLEEALRIFDELGGTPTPQQAAAFEHFAMLPLAPEWTERRLQAGAWALAMRRQIHGDDHFLTSRPLEVIALTHFHAGNDDEAEASARRCFELRLAEYGEQDWRTWSTAWLVWIPMIRRGALAEAAVLIERAVAATTASLGARGTKRVVSYLENLVTVRELQRDEAGEAAVRARIRQLTGGGR